MANLLAGKKTYIGLAISLLGALGVFKYISEADLASFLDVGFQIAGLAFAWYGRYKAKPKK